MGIFDFFKKKSNLTDEESEKHSLSYKEELKINLDSIQKEIFKVLKPLGFKKKGRTFNRQTENGIYQVINLQSGKYEFGDKYVIPLLRENFYGKFTVNLGVMIKEIYELDPYHKQKDIYQDYNCQIRTRLTHLTIKQDLWWDISNENTKTASEVIEGLSSHGLNWLDSFESRDKICKNLGNKGSYRRAELDVALIEFHRDKPKGEKLFQHYYDNIEVDGHEEYVKRLASQIGVKLKEKN